jgi:beta-phosphoglucomutase-like phosphatase (HAD superfamily)
LGRVLTQEELNTKFIGRTNAEIWPYLMGHVTTPGETARLTEEKEAAYRELLLSLPGRVTLVDGAVQLFETCLAHGIEIAIGTAAGKTNVDFYIETFGLHRWFKPERIVFDDGTMPGKPDPALFATAISRLGVPPQKCIVVEDGVLGIQAARAAGAGKVYGIWADQEDRAKLAKVALDRTIHTYKEMGLDDFR